MKERIRVRLGAETVLVLALNRSHMRGLGALTGAFCVKFRRASFLEKSQNIEKHISHISRIWDNWKKQISNISRIGLNQKNTFSNIPRIMENVADLNFQYFQAGNK